MPAKKRATVTLSAKAAAAIEAKLRDALEDAETINLVVDPTLKDAKVKVPLSPATLARFTEHLRKGLVEAEAINLAQSAAVDRVTGKVR